MKTSLQLNKLLNNSFALKVFALGMAVVLWVFVTVDPSSDSVKNNEANNIGQETVASAIKIIGLASDMSLKNSLPEVNLTIQGSQVNLNKLKPENIVVTADLSEALEGANSIALQVDLPEGIQLISTNPETVEVQLEATISKSFAVNLQISGQAAEGYICKETRANPEQITITGLRHAVESVTGIEAMLALNGESASFSKTVAPIVLTGSTEEHEVSWQLSDDEIVVKVTIEAEGETAEKQEPEGENTQLNDTESDSGDSSKNVAIEVISSGEPAEGYIVKSITVVPGEMIIYGSEEVLTGISSLKTDTIDISGFSESWEGEIPIIIPDGAVAQETQVRVIIEIEAA